MNRQAVVLPTPIEVHQVIQSLMSTTGTCVCGRVMRNVVDPKFILINALPSKAQMIVAAYCKECAVHINAALKRCRQVLQQPTIHTEPVDISKIKKNLKR